MLLQDNKPVAFASKSFIETECCYTNIERELLDVVYGCEIFHTYIYGSNFVVETDHNPLEIISLKNLTSAPSRLQRMLLRIQGYDATIRYRPGRDMFVADAMLLLPSNRHELIDLDIKVTFVHPPRLVHTARPNLAHTSLDCRSCKGTFVAWDLRILDQLSKGVRARFPDALTYKYSYDRAVIAALRARTLGNSPTALRNSLQEAHSEAYTVCAG